MKTYPQLYIFSRQEFQSLAGKEIHTVGTDPDCDIFVSDPTCAPLHFQISCEFDRYYIEPVSDDSDTFLNGQVIRDVVPLPHRGIIQAGDPENAFVYLKEEAPDLSSPVAINYWLLRKLLAARKESEGEAGPAGKAQQTITCSQSRDIGMTIPGTITLEQRPMLIGRDENAVEIHLPHVQVSRKHAHIRLFGNKAELTDLNSANGTFVDGERLSAPKTIAAGDEVDIGPYSMIFTGAALYPRSREDNVDVVARNIVREVIDRDTGRPLRLLDDISLVIKPKEFVVVLGPSGSGKSTLLSALSARVAATSGSVLINGENLYANFEALKQNTALVPQKDILHDVLPLEDALRYTAKLRLPPDTSDEDIEKCIQEMLDIVDLSKRRGTSIRNLSGGQIKRASLSNELLSKPSLIFLDEVTSGLDELTDSEMMELFRTMADSGKTIVCVTHSVSYVKNNCHLVIVLARGGNLAFVGAPEEACEYFEVDHLGEVYETVEFGYESDRKKENKANKSKFDPAIWKERFKKSSYYQQYVVSRLPDEIEEKREPPYRKPRTFKETAEIVTRQLKLLSRRYLAIQLADVKNLAMMFGQSIFVGVLICWLFGNLSNLEPTEEEVNVVSLELKGEELERLEERDRKLNEREEAIIKERAELDRKQKQAGEVVPAGTAEDDEESSEKTPVSRSPEEVAKTRKQADYSARIFFLLGISCIWFGCNNAAKEIVKERSIYEKERDVNLNNVSYFGSKLILLGVLSVLQATLLYVIVVWGTNLQATFIAQWLIIAFTSLCGVTLGLAISAASTSEDLAITLVPITLIPQIIFAGLIAKLTSTAKLFSQFFISTYWSYHGMVGHVKESWREELPKSVDKDTQWLASCSVLLLHIVAFSAAAILFLRYRETLYRQLGRIILRKKS